MLWRKKNAYKELVEIVRQMPFINSTGTKNYPHPHSQKRYPYDTMDLFEKELDKVNKEESLLIKAKNSEEYIDERKTTMISFWVQRTCPWNDGNGNYQAQFKRAREVNAYFKRSDEFEKSI
tara:strand:+ start:617 stop:979 length:363 start_codon:yes stop_codon:yes gene_type:complete